MTFDVDFDRARRQGVIPEDDSDADIFARVLHVTTSRLRALNLGEFGLETRGDQRFAVGFATLAVSDRPSVVELVTRRGTLEFLIEVLPDEEYARRASDPAEAPGRKRLWPGSAAEYWAFKKNEIARWKRAKAANEPYVPTRPGLRLVPEEPKGRGGLARFHLLEVPSIDQRFDGRMLGNPTVANNPQTQTPVVLFDIAPEWQEAFGAWTEANQYLPMAIVLDGTYRSAPVIQARLSQRIQIMLPSGSRKTMAREARALRAALQAGSLPLQPTLVSIVER